MEHKLDDFFRKKIDSVKDTLPENSTFDEQLFWGELQKNRDKPQAKGRWKWIAVAACLGGMVLWVVLISRVVSETPKTVYIQRVEPSIGESTPIAKVIAPQKTKIKPNKPKKIEEVQTKKELEVKIEQLDVKVNSIPTHALSIKQDSIYFKPATMAEVNPQFNTIHVNEISNTEKSPVPQAKFKIRFAARSQQ